MDLITRQVKAKALELGAGVVGICSSLALSDNLASLNTMLPESRSVVCILFPHSETALSSTDVYLKQYDTIFCYGEIARISHQLARYLEGEGYQAVAVPAFLPLDMADEKLGMVGAIDWKRVAAESGLASRGKSGLAVSPRFGPRMRIGGIITTAELRPDQKVAFSPCDGCQLCVESCPAGALARDGGVDKKRCGEHVFTYGLRAFTRLLTDLATAGEESRVREIVMDRRTREIWQALETGNYYQCWTCQSVCPAGKHNAGH